MTARKPTEFIKTLRALFLGSAVAATGSLAYGQTDADIIRAKSEVAKMRKSLNLTDDRVAKFQQIDLDSKAKLAQAQQSSMPQRKAKETAVEAK